MFNKNISSIGIYAKILQTFSHKFLFGNTGGRLCGSYSQKIEERQLGNVGGTYGRLKWDNIQYDFLLQEYEFDFSPQYESGWCSVARHRGIRLHIKKNKREVQSKIREIFQCMDEMVTKVAAELDFKRSLMCKECLKQKKSGLFEITKEMERKLDDDFDIDSVCPECLTDFSDPFSSTSEIIEQPVQETSPQSVTYNIYNTYIWMTLDQQLQDRLTDGQKKFIERQCLTTLHSCPPLSARSIPKFDTILRSVCMIEGPNKGTGFLAKIAAYPEMACFMTAGHMFEKNEILDKNIDFSKYVLHFGNVSGDPNEQKTCTMGDFGPFRGSIALDGQRRDFPGNKEANARTNPFEDYCVLLFPRTKLTRGLLKSLNLTCLRVGEDSYLDYQRDEVVSIFGHPGENAREGPIDPRIQRPLKRPLRVCFGKEKCAEDAKIELESLKGKRDISPTKYRDHKEDLESSNFLFYDNDTLEGNSGSPVIGRGAGGQGGEYAVKGIHINAMSKLRINGSQKLNKLKNWIP